MTFIEVAKIYFHGEKMEAYWFILPTGMLLVILGLVALKVEKGGFAWGVAIPCFVFGLVLIGTGLGVGMRTDSQIANLETIYSESPIAMVEKELPRMEKVNANFRLTYFVFGAMAFLGLLVHYLGGPTWGRGLGVVLVLAGAIGLLIDGFAERRAEPYTTELRKLSDGGSR